MRLPKLLQPIRDGAELVALRVARSLQRKPPPTPSLEEFASPLREQIKDHLAVKGDIGYAPLCACCRAHEVRDQHIADAVASLEDPQPWLAQLHGELIETRAELERTQVALTSAQRDAEQWKNPLNRIRWLAAGGTVGIVFLVAKELVQLYLLPLIIP